MNNESDYFIDKLIHGPFETQFEIKSQKNNYGKVVFKMPGEHNALNALAAFSIAINLDLNPKKLLMLLNPSMVSIGDFQLLLNLLKYLLMIMLTILKRLNQSLAQ